MRVLIAPQGFKGTLSGAEAAEAIAQGVACVLPGAEADLLPIADGGHGTLDALVGATRGSTRTTSVTGPLGHTVDARWGVLGDGTTAVIEMAQASGLTLVPERHRDPMLATTYGTGQLIAAALDAGFRDILVGVGGSATVDGGAGAVSALGVRLTDSAGDEVPLGAAGLARLAHVDLSHRHPALANARVRVAIDVSNPLCGPQGAAMVYGPQKGATPDQLPILDASLAHLALIAEQDLGVRVRDLRGAGAAGGLAAGLVAFADAELIGGAALVCDTVGINAHIEHADLVITGEGRLDAQTMFNKAPLEAARRASAAGVPCVAVAGSIGPGAEQLATQGVALMEATLDDGSRVPDEGTARSLLVDATERLVRRALRAGLVSAKPDDA